MNKDQCQFVVEQECLNLEKEKCKDFPELICEIGTAEKIVDKCEEVQDQQVKFSIRDSIFKKIFSN